MRCVLSSLRNTCERRKERACQVHEFVCRLCRMLQDVRFTLRSAERFVRTLLRMLCEMLRRLCGRLREDAR